MSTVVGYIYVFFSSMVDLFFFFLTLKSDEKIFFICCSAELEEVSMSLYKEMNDMESYHFVQLTLANCFLARGEINIAAELITDANKLFGDDHMELKIIDRKGVIMNKKNISEE